MHPLFLRIGPIELRWYGVLIAIGFLAAVWLATRRARKGGFDPDLVPALSFWIMLGAFAMARAFYVIQNWKEYAAHPVEILRIDHGGIVYYGGLIGGTLATIVYARVRKMNFFQLADLMMPSLALAHAFGRLGCFMNGCCYGAACALSWGVEFPASTVAAWGPDAPVGAVHPTQLYEAAFLFYLCVSLMLIDRTKRFEGQTFASYALLYSLFRFIVEFWRGDVPRMEGLTIAQWISIVIFLASWWWLARKRKQWAATRRDQLLDEVEKLKADSRQSG